MSNFQQAIKYYNEGLKLFERGNIEEAIESFQHSIESDPSDPDVYVNLGVALIKQGKLAEAIEAFENSIELDPIYSRPFNNLGVCFYRKGNLDKSQELFDKAIDYDDSYIAPYLNLSVVYKQKGLVNTSIEMYMKALSLSSKDEKDKSYTSGISFLEDSSKSFDKIFRLTEYDLLASGRWERAQISVEDILNTYKLLHEDEEESPESFFNMGIELFKKAKYEEAIEYFEKSIDMDNKYYPSYYNIGLAHEMIGNVKEAATSYAQSIKIKPTLATYLSLAIMLYKLGNYSQAMYNIEKAKNFKVHNSETFNNIGYTLFKISKVDDAIEFYNKAIQEDPLYAMAYYNLGVIYSKIGELNKAIESYLSVIEIEPENVPALNNLGVAYENIGDFDKAADYYQKCLDVNPKYSIAYENLFEILKRKEN